MADHDRAGLDGLITPPLSRRGFVMTSLMSGLTLATTRVEAQVIHTDPTGIEAGEVKIRPQTGRCRPIGRFRRAPAPSRSFW